MICEVCGRSASFFTETYDPRMRKSRTIWLCEKHQNELFLEISKWLWKKKEDVTQESSVAYGIGNTPTFIPEPPRQYEIKIEDLKGDDE